jgi:hypothetical protein
MFKFEEILEKLKQIDLNKTWWVVISGFDKEDKLLFTKWIIFSDKTRKENLKNLYDQFVLPNKKVNLLVINFIENLEEITDPSILKSLDMKKYWIFIGDSSNKNGTFVLPNTKGVENFATAYKAIKQKITFSSPKVNVYRFTTKMFTI